MKEKSESFIRNGLGRSRNYWLRSQLLLLLFFSGFLYAQALPFRETVTLTMKNASLKDVIWAIELQTDFVFMYSSEDLGQMKKIDVNLKDKTVEEVLKECLKDSGLTWQLQDNVVVIKPALPAPQETKKISGVVKDKTGQTLPGATVLIKGTGQGVAAGNNGEFSLSLPANVEVTLVFSYIGMITKEVKYTGQTTLNIVLEEDAQSLDEAVIIGYQSVQKRNTTSSIASIRGEALADIPAASLTELLSGKVAGLQSLSLGGAPGSRNALVIRGNTVVSGNLSEVNEFSDPLYVIDGIPTTLADLAGYDATNTDYLASLNPDDIESIDILKDASAAAIYGSRGANGVIIIKTKGGKPGKIQVSAKAYFGVTTRPELKNTSVGATERRLKMAMIKQWWSYAAYLDGTAASNTMMLTDSLNPAFNNNYDYQGMFYRPGLVQSYDISLSGGKEDLNYRLGFGYYNEKGTVKGTGFQRYSMTLNLTQKPFKSFENNTVVRLSYGDRQTGMGMDGNPHNIFPVSPFNMNSSLFEMTDEQLQFLTGNLTSLYNTNRNIGVSLSNFANLNLYKGITLNSQVGLVFDHNKKDYFQPSFLISSGLSYASFEVSERMTANIETYLSYSGDIAEHHNISILLGNSFEFNQRENRWANGSGGSSDGIKTLTGYKKEDINGSSYITMNSLLSYWARFMYRYRDRYLMDFTYRRDASSRFGKDNRWAQFPAVSAGWIVSEEPFMAAIRESWLTFFKVKASLGKTGKQFSEDYLRYNMYLLNQGNLGGSAGLMNRTTYNGVAAALPDFNKLADDKLSWEKSTQWNIGLDAELFHRRLYITFDAYNRETESLLFNVAFPGYTGFSNVKANVAGIMNYGYELSFDGYVFERGSRHQIQIQAGLSHNDNKITKLPNGNRDYVNGLYGYSVGRPGPIFYGMEYLGPLDNVADLPINPFTGKPLDPTKGGVWASSPYPGYPMWKDANGDYLVSDVSEQDLQFIEKNSNPKLMGHLNFNFTYKQWKMRVNTQYAFGRDVYDNVSRQILDRYGRGADWIYKAMINPADYDFWTEEGCGAYYPALFPTGATGMKAAYPFRDNSSMWWENGSYWKINDITLSYNFEQQWMKKIGLDRAYVYGTMYNVWQWQKAKHVMDVSVVDARGWSLGDGYPLPKKYVFGLNIQF